MKKVNFQELCSLSEKKLLSKKKHPDKDLFLFKYTPLVTYQKLWTEETLMCRGLVCDSSGNIVIYPMRKFFNHNEITKFKQPEELFRAGNIYKECLANPENYDFSVFVKWDGFLALASYYNNESLIISSNAFVSEHQGIAKSLIEVHDKYKEINENETFVFEIISKRKPICVNYQDKEEAIYLGKIVHETGEFIRDFNNQVNQFNNLQEIEEELGRPDYLNKEGFIVDITNKLTREKITCKFKYEKYVELHRLAFNISEKRIIDLLSKNINPVEELKNAPDETYEWIKEKTIEIQEKFASAKENCLFIYRDCLDKSSTRKVFAIRAKEHKEIFSLLMKLYDGKEIDESIYESLRDNYG